MKKNGFLTFCFALIPGCGQMYQGYMKRGLSLMFWFFIVIGIGSLSGVEMLMILLPVIWAYSFFDTFNIRNLLPEQRAAFPDEFIPGRQWMSEAGWQKSANIRFGKIAGWACIVLGALIILNNFWRVLINMLGNVFPNAWYWMDLYGGLAIGFVVGIVIIWLGLRIIRGSKKQADDDEDLPPVAQPQQQSLYYDPNPTPPWSAPAAQPEAVAEEEVVVAEVTAEEAPAEAEKTEEEKDA